MNISLRFLYAGHFYAKEKGHLCYRKGLVYCKREVDPDLLSKIVLEDLLKEEVGISNVKELWYLQSGKSINEGLELIKGDSDILLMLNCVGSDRLAHLYVIKDTESSPSSLRGSEWNHLIENPTQHVQSGAQLSLVPSHMKYSTRLSHGKNKSFSTPINLKARPKNKGLVIVDTQPLVEEDLTDDEGSILGSESSSSDDDFGFKDSEDEDDDIFDDYVDIDVVDDGFLATDDAQPMGNEDECLDDSDELNSICGSDDETRVRYPEFNPLVDFKKPICLKENMLFASNEIFRKALRQFSIENGGDYYYLHNDKSKVSAYCKLKCDCSMKHARKKCVCKKILCRFKACARRMGSDGTFQLKTFVPKHDCSWQDENSKVNSIWLAEKYIEYYRLDPEWKLPAFIGAVQRDYGVTITYWSAWRARLRAVLMTHGDGKEQYGLVWDYVATIRKWNPGSSAYVKVCLEVPERPLFQRLYVCLVACKKGFLMGCRPIVGLDGCHLKGAYTGQVLAAVGKDGNENIFPIAYAVVEAERKETWGWFLENLLRDIGSNNPTFMSDRQKGLTEALKDIAPLADTRVCVRHLYNNFKVRWPGKAFKDAVWASARACIKADFESTMEEIRTLDQGAYKYLLDANPETWSRHGFTVHTKSDMLLNNVCESFNAYILDSRDKPILAMCEAIRRKLMKRFVAKREGMSKYEGAITPNTSKRIGIAKEESRRMCIPHWGGENRFEVDDSGRTFVVDLVERSCGCKKWDLTGIPCPHAICCIVKKRLKVEDFVHSYYTKETYMRAYGSLIQPMPGKLQWERTNRQPPEPPKYVVQPGRPKKARKREKGEDIPSKQKRVRIFKPRCSHCGHEGHYKNKCTNPPKPLEPLKSKKGGGRPSSSKTVYVASQKRKKRSSVQVPSTVHSLAGSQLSDDAAQFPFHFDMVSLPFESSSSTSRQVQPTQSPASVNVGLIPQGRENGSITTSKTKMGSAS